MVDLGDLPTWIEAGATVGAFGAASLAARWTAKTAGSAREQVDAAQNQVQAAQEQVAIARDQVRQTEENAQRQLSAVRAQLELADKEARAVQARFLRTQLDAFAPVVYARAMRPRLVVMEWSHFMAASDRLFNPENGVLVELRVETGDQRFFGVTFVIEFVNCSDKPARIDFIEFGNGEIEGVPQGQEITLPPNERREVVWFRRMPSAELHREDRINDGKVAFAQIKYWVRDLGMNVQDTYAFNLDLRYFSVDGSRLLVKPQPAYPWEEKFAGQIPPRVYERLEAPNADSGS